MLLTHAHSDHTGFAERARAEAGARVWIEREDEEAARTGKAAGKNDGKVTSYLLRPAFYRTAFSLLRRGASRIIPIAEVSAFGDSERIDVPGSPRAVHAPGHTPGSAAILVDSRRTLFTGDVMAMENPLTGRAGPQIMPSGLNQDTPQALASLDALLGIDADLLLPGHGDPWRQGTAEAVGRARAARPLVTAYAAGGLAARRTRSGGGEQAEGEGRLHGAGAAVGAELGVHAADVGLDGVGETDSSRAISGPVRWVGR